MGDEPKLLPKEGVRGIAWYVEGDRNRFLPPGWYFDEERSNPHQISAVLYPAEGSIVDEMATLLEMAYCPHCDGSGVIPSGDPQGDYWPEPCQWCYERNYILDRYKETDDE